MSTIDISLAHSWCVGAVCGFGGQLWRRTPMRSLSYTSNRTRSRLGSLSEKVTVSPHQGFKSR